MAHGEVNIDKGRDNALLVSTVLGAAPADETAATVVQMVGDTSFEFTSTNSTTDEDCRGAPHLLTINGSSAIAVAINYSGLMTDEAYQAIKKAHRTKAKVWAGKLTPGGLDYNGLWLVTEHKETIGLDESVKSTFALKPAGVIELPDTLRPLKTGA